MITTIIGSLVGIIPLTLPNFMALQALFGDQPVRGRISFGSWIDQDGGHQMVIFQVDPEMNSVNGPFYGHCFYHDALFLKVVATVNTRVELRLMEDGRIRCQTLDHVSFPQTTALFNGDPNESFSPPLPVHYQVRTRLPECMDLNFLFQVMQLGKQVIPWPGTDHLRAVFVFNRVCELAPGIVAVRWWGSFTHEKVGGIRVYLCARRYAPHADAVQQVDKMYALEITQLDWTDFEGFDMDAMSHVIDDNFFPRGKRSEVIALQAGVFPFEPRRLINMIPRAPDAW